MSELIYAAIFGSEIEKNSNLFKDIYNSNYPFNSHGTEQKSGNSLNKPELSFSLKQNPEVLILEEPTTGEDPVSRQEFWRMVHRLKSGGITIIVSTPNLDDANLCDRILLIHNGYLLSINTPEAMIKEYHRKLFSIHTTARYDMIRYLKSSNKTYSVFLIGEEIHYSDKRQLVDKGILKEEWEQECNFPFTLDTIPPTIEDCFMSLMSTKKISS